MEKVALTMAATAIDNRILQRYLDTNIHARGGNIDE